MLNKDMQDMKDFLLNRDGWELKEIIEETISDTNMLKYTTNNGKKIDLSIDECSIVWVRQSLVIQFVDLIIL